MRLGCWPRTLHLPICLIGIASVGSLSGCGSAVQARANVSGKIMLGGQPPKVPGQIEIVFEDPQGKLSSARIAEDGSYTAEGLVVGQANIAFIYLKRESLDKGAERTGRKLVKAEKQAPVQPAIEDIPNPIPIRYREARTSGLTFAVQASQTNTFNFDIPLQ